MLVEVIRQTVSKKDLEIIHDKVKASEQSITVIEKDISEIKEKLKEVK